MNRQEEIESLKIQLLHGDCLELMKNIPDGSVDMVLTDPPYGTVKGLGDDKKISHGMKNKTEWDVNIPLIKMWSECNRILRTKGALLLFGQEPYTSKLITNTHENLPFCYRYIWLKDHFANSLISKKAPVNYTEDICVFFKKYDTLNQHPLRGYAQKIMNFGKIKSLRQIKQDIGSDKAEHFFRIHTDQFGICTKETYNILTTNYNLQEMPEYKTFEEMQEINHKFNRVFNLPTGKKFKSNVLEYKKDYNGYHPTQKPVTLGQDLIKTYTNKGDTVLDFTAGSGSFGVAAIKEGRNFIGIEKEEKYFKIMKERITSEIKDQESNLW